jgi:hypothetical protein
LLIGFRKNQAFLRYTEIPLRSFYLELAENTSASAHMTIAYKNNPLKDYFKGLLA